MGSGSYKGKDFVPLTLTLSLGGEREVRGENNFLLSFPF